MTSVETIVSEASARSRSVSQYRCVNCAFAVPAFADRIRSETGAARNARSSWI